MSKNYACTTNQIQRQKVVNWGQLLYAWACERLYAEFAWSYDWVSWFISFGRWSQWRALALDYMVGEAILELGFGTGELLLALHQRGEAVVGLELSPAMQRQVTKKMRRRGVTVPRLQARAQATGLATATFDTIISTFPAPYIFEAATLAECHRLLRPGGRLVIVLGVAAGPQSRQRFIPLFYGAPSTAWHAHLRERFQAAGFMPTFIDRDLDGLVVQIIVAQPNSPADSQP